MALCVPLCFETCCDNPYAKCLPDLAQQFAAYAEQAKAGCPVSKVLKANITMSAKLES